MKNHVQLILLCVLFINCSERHQNEDLFGHWTSFKSANIVEIKFSKHYFISNSWEEETKFSWHSDSDKIYYTQLTNLNPDLEADFILEYELNATKDTLTLRNFVGKAENQFVKTSSN